MKIIKLSFCWIKTVCIAGVMTLLSCTGVSATEQVFSFVNPTFGGNPGNAPGLLANAQAQNTTKAPFLSPLQTFQTNLQNAILSHLSSLAITSIFKGDTT